MKPQNFQLNQIDNSLIELALLEDLGSPYCDLTTQTLFPQSNQAYTVQIISKADEEIIICGIPVITSLLSKIEGNVTLNTRHQDGDILQPGEQLLTLHGNANTILMAERTLLNFLRHLSAISTLTQKLVKAVEGTPLKILDTRKTTPGFRHLEKYAVACGGGVNHRLGLYDAFMIKDNHNDLIGGLEQALSYLPNLSENPFPVIVEVRTLEELETVLTLGKNKVSRVLLDNMTPTLLATCVKKCNGIMETEASGNINLNTIKAIAETGVDYASVGMLTYAAGQVDLSMIAV